MFKVCSKFEDSAFTTVKRDAKFLDLNPRYVKGVPLVDHE